MKDSSIVVYTDGSCNPEHGIGAWATILFIGEEKTVLVGKANQTTHQRMELTAVIKAFEYLAKVNLMSLPVRVFTDSQYVVGIPGRSVRLKKNMFNTNKGVVISNEDLVQQLIGHSDKYKPTFIKVRAHQYHDKQNVNHEVDKLSRKLVREAVDLIIKK